MTCLPFPLQLEGRGAYFVYGFQGVQSMVSSKADMHGGGPEGGQTAAHLTVVRKEREELG